MVPVTDPGPIDIYKDNTSIETEDTTPETGALIDPRIRDEIVVLKHSHGEARKIGTFRMR